MTKDRWVPFTPAGSMLAHIEENTSAKAWAKLLEEASHMYRTVEEMKARGYTVEKAN